MVFENKNRSGAQACCNWTCLGSVAALGCWRCGPQGCGDLINWCGCGSQAFIWTMFFGSMLLTAPVMLGSTFHARSQEVIKFEDFKIEYERFHGGLSRLQKSDYKKTFLGALPGGRKHGVLTCRHDTISFKSNNEHIEISPKHKDDHISREGEWEHRFFSFFLDTVNKENKDEKKYFLEGSKQERYGRKTYHLLSAKEVKRAISSRRRVPKVNVGGIINSLNKQNCYLGAVYPDQKYGFYDRFYFSNYDGLVRLADLTGSTTAKLSSWSFWTKTKMGVALSYTGPIYWVGLVVTNTIYYTFFGVTGAATWCATNLNLWSTIKPVPWVPSKVGDDTFPIVETWVNGWGSLLDDPNAVETSKEESTDDEKKKKKDSKDSKDTKKEESKSDSEESKKKRGSDKNDSVEDSEKSWWGKLHIGWKIGLFAGIFLILVLSIIGCYCAFAGSNQVVMYDAENPMMMPRRQSMVPARRWPPRRSSRSGRRGSSRY